MQSRDEILNAILDAGLIAIIRLKDAAALESAALAIHGGGVHVIEFTLNSPGALDAIRATRAELPGAIIGAGTVLTAEQAEAATDAGAQLIVSPNTKREVIEAAQAGGAVAVPGAYTPNEIAAAMDLGADLVKLFPAKGLGPQYLREVRGPLDNAQIVPTGGVTVDSIADYFDAGAAAVAVGGGIVNNDLIGAGDYVTIAANARLFQEAADAARGKEA